MGGAVAGVVLAVVLAVAAFAVGWWIAARRSGGGGRHADRDGPRQLVASPEGAFPIDPTGDAVTEILVPFDKATGAGALLRFEADALTEQSEARVGSGRSGGRTGTASAALGELLKLGQQASGFRGLVRVIPLGDAARALSDGTGRL